MQLATDPNPSALNQTNHKPGPRSKYFGSNRRECLFYHSTDNSRLGYTHRQQQQFVYQHQQQILKEQQKKFIERQQEIDNNNNVNEDEEPQRQREREPSSRVLSKNSCIYSYDLINRPSSAMNNPSCNVISSGLSRVDELYRHRGVKAKEQKSPLIMHSAPFNITNQIQCVSELFKEDANNGISLFDRNNVNQLSTKSQPAHHQQHKDQLFFSNNIIPPMLSSSNSSTSSSATSSSSTTPIENKISNQQQKQFRSVILPQPAQV